MKIVCTNIRVHRYETELKSFHTYYVTFRYFNIFRSPSFKFIPEADYFCSDSGHGFRATGNSQKSQHRLERADYVLRRRKLQVH